MLSDCLISFGANLGDRQRAFQAVLESLETNPSIENISPSRPIQTQPVGGPPDQQPYLNAVIRFETSLDSTALMQTLFEIERNLGRKREERWAPRTVDLDILLFGQEVRDHRQLHIPHPRMSFRRFVIEPAAEIAPDFVHPISGLTISQLLEHLNHRENIIALCGVEQDLFLRLQTSWADHVDFAVEFSLDSSEVGQTNKNEWRVVWVGCHEDLESMAGWAKLMAVVHWQDDRETPQAAERLKCRAQRFPGPTVGFSATSASQITQQLAVTIDAMVEI